MFLSQVESNVEKLVVSQTHLLLTEDLQEIFMTKNGPPRVSINNFVLFEKNRIK